MLLIAHRPELVAQADRVVHLVQGSAALNAADRRAA
jgi:ABC-type multidrug transport system fused ATPase/permease subunit